MTGSEAEEPQAEGKSDEPTSARKLDAKKFVIGGTFVECVFTQSSEFSHLWALTLSLAVVFVLQLDSIFVGMIENTFLLEKS
jgi:hypothetical protein